MPKRANPTQGYRSSVRVNSSNESRITRLCQYPERVPGQAPPCEDDKIQTPGEYKRRATITLPKLRFLEGKS